MEINQSLVYSLTKDHFTNRLLQASQTCCTNRRWLNKKFPFVIANVLKQGNTVNTTGIWVIVVL